MLKDLTKSEWLEMLGISAEDVPAVLILRGTRNLQAQYEVARGHFSSVCDLGAPNGLIETVLIGEISGVKVGFACVYGAPMASEVVHIFGVLGARAVIQTGNCGGLADDMVAGDIVIPSVAFCGEGAAQYYTPETLRVAASPELCSACALEGLGVLPVHRGPIYTTAALLAEGESEIEAWHRQGFVAVDMETATSFSVADAFGMDRISILYVFDNPRRGEHLLVMDPAKDTCRSRADSLVREVSFALALELSQAMRVQHEPNHRCSPSRAFDR